VTALACTVSGCGSTAAYLDTSTARVSGWVEVRRHGGAAATATWHCSAVCAALALAGAEVEVAVRTRLADLLDIEAAVFTALDDPVTGDTALSLARRQGLATARRIVARDQPDEGEARCHLCGCAEDDPCAGICAWVPDGMRDTCTACAPPAPCTTGGCGTPEDEVDGNDPTLWGWICVYVGGSDVRMRWVCSPVCAAAAIEAGGAELAAGELAASAGGDGRG
jgi:hypothetical protein